LSGLKVVLAGGGTAGHVNPLLATASVLKARGHDVTVIGTREGLEADLVPRAGFPLAWIDKVPLPRRPSLSLLKVPSRLLRAVAQAGRAMDDAKADVVVGFGGYVSAPAYWAARRRKIPVIVHEGNARPGIANRLGARFAAAIAVTFEGTPLKGARLTGLPLREDIRDLAATMGDPAARDEARSLARLSLGWPDDAPAVLVTGGSTGAASINRALAEAIEQLTGHGVHVLHLTGVGKADGALRAHGDLPARLRHQYVVREYEHDIARAFAAVDAVVCRAGAGNVSEVTALGLPALYIPLPIGNGEQALNAAGAIAAGAATILPDAAMTPTALMLAIEALVLDEAAHARMSAAARAIGISDGANILADLIEEHA